MSLSTIPATRAVVVLEEGFNLKTQPLLENLLGLVIYGILPVDSTTPKLYVMFMPLDGLSGVNPRLSFLSIKGDRKLESNQPTYWLLQTSLKKIWIYVGWVLLRSHCFISGELILPRVCLANDPVYIYPV